MKILNQLEQALEQGKTSNSILKRRVRSEQQAKIASKKFEGVFISQMLKPMFKGIDPNGLFGGGQAEKVWQGFFIDEVAKEISKQDGFGLAGNIERQMLARSAYNK